MASAGQNDFVACLKLIRELCDLNGYLKWSYNVDIKRFNWTKGSFSGKLQIMKKFEMEYRAECPKCQETYSGDTLWKVCPVCVTELKQISTKRCQPVPSEHLAHKGAFTIAEVSAMTGFSSQMVTRLVENEPGVIILDRPTKMNKRRYRSIRIPRAVYERVIRKLSFR